MTEKQAYKILTNTPIRAKENHTEYSRALHIALDALEKQFNMNEKPRTQFERIKAMDVTEMANFMAEKLMPTRVDSLVEENPNMTATHMSFLQKRFSCSV